MTDLLHGPIVRMASLFLLLRLDLNDLGSPIVPTRRANVMGKPQLATLRAGDELDLLESQVTAPSITSALGYLPLW